MVVDVAAIAVRGRWLKHTYPDSLALPKRDPPPDNRWQRGDVVDALYLADEEDTVWAEWYRHLAEQAIPPLAQMPRDLWTWEIDIDVADLSTAERLDAADLPLPRPGQRTWPACQHVGESLWNDGWPGLLAPSAERRVPRAPRAGSSACSAMPMAFAGPGPWGASPNLGAAPAAHRTTDLRSQPSTGIRGPICGPPNR